MKLLFVHDRLGAMAGAESNLFACAAALAKRGHQLGLLHGPGTGREESSWRVVFSAYHLPLVSEDRSAVTRALEEFQPEVIYVHNMDDLQILQALLECPVPVVRMVHDHSLYCMRGYKYHPFTRRICRRKFSAFCVFPCGGSFRRERGGGFPLRWVSFQKKSKEIRLHHRMNRLVVATDYMKGELLRNGFEARHIEVLAPVPPNPAPPTRSTFSDRNLIVYAGQMTRGKGVDVLLESLARVPDRFECVLLGDGHYLSHCRELARHLRLEDRVKLPGYVPQTQLGRFFSEASIAVMSSVWPEPFGAAGLEAMRWGLPVVAFDAGGIREWLIDGTNGYLVPWMDRGEFARRIALLLRNKALARRLGENGRRLAGQQFDFDSYINHLEGLFAQVLDQVRHASV